MELSNLKNVIPTFKKGTFIKAQWQSEKVIDSDTYTKKTNGVVRLVCYGHIKDVEVKGRVNENEIVIIPNILYHNNKTGKDYIQFATTTIKPMVKYYLNGVEIDKVQYEQAIPPKNRKASPVFRLAIENLISLGC